MKRAFDMFASAVGLVLVSPILLVTAVAIRITAGKPILFRQQRVGRNFRLFFIYKFRTMVSCTGGPELTAPADNRVTAVGKILRHMKVDELPQLFNVLLGDMSLVGPRPEVPSYVELYKDEYRDILGVRPGITDLASLKYRNESEVLGHFDDPVRAYTDIILPDKIRLGKEYVRRSSLLFDIELIVKTVLAVAH
jgi:lipopolysaccharide/colanic/teichoic acid biosynthesis glycosyltransferase